MTNGFKCYLWLATALPLVLWNLSAAAGNEPSISMELLTEQGFAIDGAQKWHDMLTQLGVSSLQIHSAQGGEKTAVENKGSAENPRYKVVGILTRKNELKVTGGSFTQRDKEGVKKWLSTLGDRGTEGVAAGRTAFGLMPSDADKTAKEMAQKVDFKTAGQKADKLISEFERKLEHPIEFAKEAGQALSEAEVTDDLQGMTFGTALAIVARPAGLVLAPERPDGGALRYRLIPADNTRESWPLGHKSRLRPSQLTPAVFQAMNVEISDIAAADVLAALVEQLKAPVLVDPIALAEKDIDLTTLKINLPAKKDTCGGILDKVAAAASLKADLRVDEGGKPFFWLTTTKRLK